MAKPATPEQDTELSTDQESEKELSQETVEQTPLTQEDGEEVLADVESLEATIAEQKEQLLRVSAEFENFRRRQTQEQKRVFERQKESILREMLPIMDNLERSVLSLEQESTLENLAKGIQLIEREMRKTLKELGVEKMQAEKAQFDANHHEAVMMEERDDVEDQVIIQVFENGYHINDRVLRPAKVKVARNEND